MATTQGIYAPTLGTQGEPCATCGAPLAADQRYCLECGTRRAHARLPFRDILAAGAPPPTAPVAVAAPPDEGPSARSGLAFLIGLLCLLAALGVGVLIGNSGNDKTAATTPPQPEVITVSGAAAAPAATTPAATTSTPGTSSTSSGSGRSSNSSKSSSSSSAKSSKGSAANNKKVQDLNSSSGADYQKKSEKLPKQVGTSGKAPPKDNKPAGGGTGFQEIG